MRKALIKKEDLGALVALLPEVPVFNAPAVAAEIKGLNEQASRVLESATRAQITDATAASVATDLLSAVTKRITEVDDARKLVTGKFDKLVKGLNTLYTKGPSMKLETAKTILQGKLGVFLRAERVKADAAAAAERQRIANEAAANAAAAVEEGDTAGALEIIESAAAVVVEAEKPQVRGATAMLTSPRRKVGSITNMRAFIHWLAETQTPMALAAIGGVTVGQRELNQLAAAVLTMRAAAGDDSISVPGFKAEYEETFGAR